MKTIFFLEGIDGAGKTTALTEVMQRPAPAGHVWFRTMEPVIPPPAHVTPGRAQALYYSLDRRLHLEQLLTLPDDHLILCDRGPMSMWAYQGAQQGVSSFHLTALHDLTVSELASQFTFHHIVLQLPLHIAAERIQARGEQLHPTGIVDLALAWQYYEDAPRRHPHGIVHTVNATEPTDVLADQILTIISKEV